MFHLLILAIIETLYIDIQICGYLNDGKTIIGGKAAFYHSVHCKIVDSMPKTIVPGMMVPLDNGYYLAALLKYRNDLFRIADTKFLVDPGESIQQFVDKITTGKSSFFSSCQSHSFCPAGTNAFVQSKLPES